MVDELAARQEGVITRLQALKAGMTTDAVDARLKSGRWRRMHSGVYATFTGLPGRTAMLWAAVLACGRGAVLSHETAAESWGLTGAAAHRDVTGDGRRNRPIHITIPSGRRIRPPAGVILHRSARLAASRHPVKCPPCTRLEDTVVDLTQIAAGLDAAIAVLTEAVRLRLTTDQRLLRAFEARKKLRWRAELTEACLLAGNGAHSLLEHRFVTRVERPHALPRTERQVRRRAGGRVVFVDARAAEHRVRVELDGRAGHTGSGAFRDMWRDNAAVIDGDVTLRFGWEDVTVRPCDTAAVLARVYLDRGWQGEPVACGPACTMMTTLHRLLDASSAAADHTETMR